MGVISLCFLYFSVLACVFGQENEQEYKYDQVSLVHTKQGPVEGFLSKNHMYYEYLGIRYAVPVRFRAPAEPPKFTETFKANNPSVVCPQFACNDPLTTASENEDCLVLNIFSPVPIVNGTVPVIVFLHGGDFGVGTGAPSFYGPQYLVANGLVVVTVNYRLNVYGFLNLGIEEAPGNAGLKDIRAALRWIQENIEAFGGERNNVTLLGQGSGGAAALYLTLSRSCKGLFHRIISHSGTFFTPQSFDAYPLKTASQVAKSLELVSDDPQKLLELFTETPIAKVETAISKQMHPKSVFLPSVEKVFEDEEAILTKTPFEILYKNQHKNATYDTDSDFCPVPIIIGLNTVEGLISTLDYNSITSQIDRIQHQDLSALDQRSFKVPDEDKDNLRKMLLDTYFNNSTEEMAAMVGGMINLNTDFSCVGPMSLFVDLYKNSSQLPVYHYIFNYIGGRNFGRLLTNSNLQATTNLDELFYVFEMERLPLAMTEEDARIVSFMTMMWGNFAKFGEPTVDKENGEWLPYPAQLAINTQPDYVGPLTPDRAYFWRVLYFKYGVDIPKELMETLSNATISSLF